MAEIMGLEPPRSTRKKRRTRVGSPARRVGSPGKRSPKRKNSSHIDTQNLKSKVISAVASDGMPGSASRRNESNPPSPGISYKQGSVDGDNVSQKKIPIVMRDPGNTF